jgi:hypothetical protein
MASTARKSELPNHTWHPHEKPGSQLIRERFSQLLDDPEAAGMPSDIEMQDASPTVADDEKTVQHTERDGRDSE